MDTANSHVYSEEGWAFLRDFFRLNPWLMFLISSVLYGMVLYIRREFVFTDEVYFNSLAEKLTVERIEEIIHSRRQNSWIAYAAIPVALCVQVLFTTVCLGIGVLLSDYRIKLSRILAMSVNAFLIFALGKVLGVLLLTMQDIRSFSDAEKSDVFSLLGWVGRDAAPAWLHYPLGLVNVFQFLFILCLAAGLAYYLRKPLGKMTVLVVGAYGTGLFVWAMFIVFLALSMAA